MAEALNDVRAFRGLCYDPAAVGSVADCLAQPYDVVSPEERAAYLRRHGRNIVSLTLPLGDAPYARARADLDAWIAQGILSSAAQPALWLYQQGFAVDGRQRESRGLLAVVRLRDFSERRILPHEKVMAAPVEDRFRLTLAVEAQLEPIWGFYRQPGPDLAPLASGEPQIDCVEPSTGARHRVWRLADARLCSELAQAAGRTEIFIADGHHRYQTMLNVREEMRQRHPGAGPGAPWEFILMYLVNADRESLTVLPYHRIVTAMLPSPLSALSRSFSVERVADWRQALAAAGREGQAFALAIAGHRERYIVARPGSGERLDVELLNDLVLRDGLGLTEEDLRLGRGVEYTHNAEAALQRVDSGAAGMAFLMNPTRLQEIESCARSAGVMPRKSSFFYPKPLSGIVLYPMRDLMPGRA